MAAVVRHGSGQSGSSAVADRWSQATPTSDQAPARFTDSAWGSPPGRARQGLLRRLARRPTIAVILLTTLWLAGSCSGRRLVYNATESEPRGWYLTRPVTRPLTRGQLVLFPVPTHVAGLVAERRWLPAGVPLLKRVGAVAGDTVCVDAMLRIRGEVVGAVLAADAVGRPLPVARSGCFTIAPGYLFPVGAAAAGSFDGRYFGVIPISAVEATAVPLWTFAR